MINSLFIFGAKYLIFVSILMSGIFFLKQPFSSKKKLVIFGIVSLVLIYGLGVIAGKLYYNPRPFVVEHTTPLIPHDASNGFPSDHVLLASALAATIYFFKKKTGLMLLGIAVLVGMSRVYVGVHHSVDVAASVVISFLGASIAYLILRKKLFI